MKYNESPEHTVVNRCTNTHARALTNTDTHAERTWTCQKLLFNIDFRATTSRIHLQHTFIEIVTLQHCTHTDTNSSVFLLFYVPYMFACHCRLSLVRAPNSVPHSCSFDEFRGILTPTQVALHTAARINKGSHGLDGAVL